jgi:DNA adenine methylase
MTDADHSQLAMQLHGCKSSIVVSGYPSELYAELYRDWRRVEIDIANHAAGGRSKGREIECLWLNF